MSIFGDKSYDDLDDISKLIEPLKSSLQDIFVELPEKVEIDVSWFAKNYPAHIGNIYRDSIISDFISKYTELDGNEMNILYNMYKFTAEFTDKENPQIVMNTEKGTQEGGELWIGKKDFTIEEEVLVSYYQEFIYNHFRNYLSINKDVSKQRFNEVAEIFDIDEILRSKGLKDKQHALCKHLKSNIQNCSLNIKDVDLIKRLCWWITAYITGDSQSAYRNMVLLKIQTHDGDAIYSIKEEAL